MVSPTGVPILKFMADWIVKQTNQLGVMSADDELNNATLMYQQMISEFTVNAICGVLGNVNWESHFNPGQWQSSYQVGDMDGGFGLVQWTPASKIFTALGNDAYSGAAQTKAIMDLTANDWIIQSNWPMSWEDFKASDLGAQYLAEVFCKNYERAGDEHMQERKDFAQHWWEVFSDNPPGPGPGPTPTPGERKKMPLMFYLKKVF